MDIGFLGKRQERGGYVMGSSIDTSQMHGVSLWKGQWVGLELVSLHKRRG